MSTELSSEIDEILETLVIREFEEVMLVTDEEFAEATQAITTIIETAVLEGRIDEALQAQARFVKDNFVRDSGNSWEWDAFEDRIKKLGAELNSIKDGGE